MDMTRDDIRDLYGWAEIDPSDPVIAGSTGTWKITYHAGRYGVDDGGVIKIAWRDISDWAHPQFDRPGEPEFATVTTSGPATVRGAFERQRFVRPWRYCVTIDVFDDSLSEGDTVTLTLGDTSGGSPGSRCQTFCKELFEFRVAVDWCGTWMYTVVPSPEIPVLNGLPAKLVVVAAAETTPGEATWVGVKAEDEWGNPCRDYEGRVVLDGGGLHGVPESYQFLPSDEGVKRFDKGRTANEGVFRVSARDETRKLAAQSNPMRCVKKRGATRPYWGDLHGQSEETVGTNPVSSYFRFARDSALVDFAGHQGNDFQITAAIWEEIKHQANTINEAGRFVAYVGYEWSGNTPLGGDHNVYYPGDDGPLLRSSHVLVPDTSDADTDCTHVTDLYRALKDTDALLVPHVGGRYANLTWHDASLEPVIEVYSEWGQFEWFLMDALEKGYRVGFTAGSDDHKGRPGAAYPGSGAFGVYGGLTCVQATDLSRKGVWDALKAHRCYGTSGQRILVDVTADGHPMGASFESEEAPEIRVQVLGTEPIERIDLFRGTEQIATFPETIERETNRIRVRWFGQRIRARKRLVRWDGSLSLSKGKIHQADGFAFDSPAEGIVSSSEREVVWKSVTTGDDDGIVLTLDAPRDAQIAFKTEVLEHQVALGDLEEGPVVVDAGGIDMGVAFERMPVGSGREVTAVFKDDAPTSGTHAYWVRVTQIDGAKAWVSPHYVTVG